MKFSCIIPAYNEWPRIAKVIETVITCKELYEVIVVNDGSTDNTYAVIESLNHPKLKKIHQENTGKAGAIIKGIQEASWDYIVMIDSDLVWLTIDHILTLIEPITQKEVDVTLSIRENSYALYKWIGSDFVSGERVLPREIFEDSKHYTDWPGFWLEVKINARIMEKGYRIKNLYLKWLISERKSVKMGYIHGTISDWKMVYQILSIMPLHRVIAQAWYFSRLGKGQYDDPSR